MLVTVVFLALVISGAKCQHVTKGPFLILDRFAESNKTSLRSGPILMIDDRTFFVTNLHYDEDDDDATFWAGKLQNGFENGFRVPQDKKGNGSLSEYSGEDLYLRIPANVERNDYDYIGVKDNVINDIITYSVIPEQSLGLSNYYKEDKDGNYIARVPKCCPVNTIKTNKGCKEKDVKGEAMKIYSANDTNFDNDPIKRIVKQWYVYKPKCPDGMYHLDVNDNYYYLSTGFLFFPDDADYVSKDKYCIDVTRDGDEVPFICFEKELVRPEYWNKIISSFIYVSAIFLIITTGIFAIAKSARDVRGYNVVGYTGFMALSFICLATARLLSLEEDTCITLGFLYQFFLVAGFTWLAILTYDTWYLISTYNVPHEKKRIVKYVIISVAVPILTVAISILCQNKIPSRFSNPTSKVVGSCAFRSDKKVIFYYIPIFISIICCVIINSITKLKITKLSADPQTGSLWTLGDMDTTLKNIFRSNYIILAVMVICWSSDLLSYFFETDQGVWIAIDIIDSLQGLFIFIVFIAHQPVYDIVEVKWRQCFGTERQTPVEHPRDEYISVSHKEKLRISHAESVESLTDI